MVESVSFFYTPTGLGTFSTSAAAELWLAQQSTAVRDYTLQRKSHRCRNFFHQLLLPGGFRSAGTDLRSYKSDIIL